MKRIELQALQSDLHTVNAILDQRSEQDDPLGVMQFRRRQQVLEAQIAAHEADHATGASVALFFGGRPVTGSRGIDADFGGRALEQFQTLVATRFVQDQGRLGARGRLPQRERAHLMLTDVARGSFGFVLEEDGQAQLVDSPLKAAVNEVLDMIYRLGAPDEEAFEAGLEDLDNRLLTSLRTFFSHLDDAGATLRLVEDTRDFSLMREDVERARERTAGLTIVDELPEIVKGQLFILPDSKRFELHPADGHIVIRGAVDADALSDIINEAGQVRPDVIGREWEVELLVRTVAVPHRQNRKTYRLMRLIEQPQE